MTRDEIMALEGRALDAQVAERVCGWRWTASAASPEFKILLPRERAGRLDVEGLDPDPLWGVADVPRYSTDLNACREAALVLPSAARVFYVDQLQALVAVCGELRFKTVEADAATRCRAMLLALEGKDE